MQKVAIIGGGISGLSFAYYLKKRFPDLLIDIFEDSSEKIAGGKMRSVQTNDSVLEVGAPFAIVENPAFLELIEDLGLGSQLIKAKSMKIASWKGGYYQKLPSGFLDFQNHMLSFWSSGIGSAFSLKKNLSIWPGLSFFDLLKSTYGESYAESNGSIFTRFRYHCEAEDIVLNGGMPELSEAIVSEKQLKKAIQLIRDKRSEFWGKSDVSSGEGFYSLKQGLGSLSKALYQFLQEKGVSFHFTHVKSIRLEKKQFEVTSKSGKFGGYVKLFAALPFHDQASLWKSESKEISEMMGGLESVSANIVYCGWNRKSFHTSGDGVFVSRKEKLNQYGTFFLSNIFPHLSSDSCFLTRTEFPGDISLFQDDEVVGMVKQDFKKLFGVEENPDWYQVYRHSAAFPKYTAKRFDVVKNIRELLSSYHDYHSLDHEGFASISETVSHHCEYVDQLVI